MRPTERTLKALKDMGRTCGMVERWIPQKGHPGGGFRKDLFGIIDVIALDPVRGVVGIQSTGQDFSGHLQKIMVEKRAETILWLSTPGASLELWGWRKLKPRGQKVAKWSPRVRVFTLAEFLPSSPDSTIRDRRKPKNLHPVQK